MKPKTLKTRIVQILLAAAMIGILIGAPTATPSAYAGDCPLPTAGNGC